MSFNIQTFPLGPLDVNCYLLSHNGEALVVDAGGAPDPVIAAIKKDNLKLTHILNTHLHFDHCYGNAALQKAYGLEILAGKEDVELLGSELGAGGVYGFPLVDPYKVTACEAGERTILGVKCKFLHTPGHTPGSLSFYFPEFDLVFTGDVLFHRSVGRTDFPRGNAKDLRRSIKEVLFTLPDLTSAYPGHGEPTNIGDEKLNNPYYGQFARI